MIKIYHNNRCSKSRQCLALIEDKEIQIVEYLKNPLTKDELSALIKKIGITPLDLVRKNESIWKENYKGQDLSDEEIISIMVENPKLIERPIVELNNKAIVCRPPDLVLNFIK